MSDFIDLQELERLFAQTTPGQWSYGNEAIWSDCNGDGNSPHEVASYLTQADGSFLAAIKNSAPAIFEILREQARARQSENYFLASSL